MPEFSPREIKTAAIIFTSGLLGFAAGYGIHAGIVERVNFQIIRKPGQSLWDSHIAVSLRVKDDESEEKPKPDIRGRVYAGIVGAFIGLGLGGGAAASV